MGAVGDADKGRHSRPSVAANQSKRNGLDAVTPTARTPPEYLNESIPEKEKEEREEAFSSFGNREKEQGGGTSDGALNPEAFPTGSPEKQVETGLSILDTSLMLADGYLPDRLERLQSLKAMYLDRCGARGIEPDEGIMAAFQERGV
ncbi:hypothetical protein [Lysobacter sp. MMG2]|uniref:hypothetical protein n=1 Tax=Lysobacter sp. MMG2 TaxID=2801338 RepID=UPI0020B2F68F|nr:hypothetical protein [Lysobacter sp. MMG2]